MRAVVLAVVVLLEATSLHPRTLHAQLPARSRVAAEPSIPEAALPVLRDGAGASWHRRVLTAIGGAAVGAGVGFFTSQVVRGDWDDQRAEHDIDRSTWAAVGGSLGFALGFSFPIAGRAKTPETGMRLPGGRFEIRAAEFRGRGVDTADDIVRLLRPEWLIERGVNIIGESPGDGLEIYLDDSRLGSARTLRDVSADIVHSMHYFDPGAATYRFGAGHSHGVILIVAEGGR